MDPVEMASQIAATTAAEMWLYPVLAVAPPPTMPAARIGGRDAVTVDESAVMDHSGGGNRAGRKRRDLAAGRSEEESSKLVSTSSGNELTDSETRRTKVVKGENGNSNTEAESSSGNFNQLTDQNAKPSEPTKQDYIHVRARRGQATDSHSLAERARREKISERMKILQDLVPGCNKVIGKASVLDEIILYIQALQRQVEFLSMKLEAVNSRMNSCMEGFSPKDFGAQTYDTAPSLAFSSQSREYEQGSAMDWLHMQASSSPSFPRLHASLKC